MPRMRASGATVSSSVTSAVHNAASITPASSRRGAPLPGSASDAPANSRRASANTSTVEASAPPNAPPWINRPPAPSNIAPSAPTAAPPEAPITYGSASGLRSNTCISAPASASSPPVPNAASARGKRNWCTICASTLPSGTNSTRSSSSGAIARLPSASDTASAAAARADSARPMRHARDMPIASSGTPCRRSESTAAAPCCSPARSRSVCRSRSRCVLPASGQG